MFYMDSKTAGPIVMNFNPLKRNFVFWHPAIESEEEPNSTLFIDLFISH